MFIYNTIKWFLLHINNMIVDTNNVCACYNLFILFETDILLTKIYSKFVLNIKAQ